MYMLCTIASQGLAQVWTCPANHLPDQFQAIGVELPKDGENETVFLANLSVRNISQLDLVFWSFLIFSDLLSTYFWSI